MAGEGPQTMAATGTRGRAPATRRDQSTAHLEHSL